MAKEPTTTTTAAAPTQPTLHLAEILSDLVSLRVCDPAAALALVSSSSTTTRPKNTSSSTTTGHDVNDNNHHPQEEEEEEEEAQAQDRDPDLQRAKDLVELHSAVKEAQARDELARGLEEARRAVERAVLGGV